MNSFFKREIPLNATYDSAMEQHGTSETFVKLILWAGKGHLKPQTYTLNIYTVYIAWKMAPNKPIEASVDLSTLTWSHSYPSEALNCPLINCPSISSKSKL